MAAMSNYRIEPLSLNNYDTWKLQAQAILIKNKLWDYVTGKKEKPIDEDKLIEWQQKDLEARSDLMIIISPSELKQVKNCITSKEVWDTLKNSFQSSGPARKATLLKKLILHKMKDSSNVREHLNSFMDIVDKLQEMDIKINDDLLCVMMLYSLPQSFENFRIAIESRDTLPSPEELKIKILEENEARNANSPKPKVIEDAYFGRKNVNKYTKTTQYKNENHEKNFKIRCYRCDKPGHIARNCRSKLKDPACTYKVEEKGHCLSLNSHQQNANSLWCLDSGSTSHICSSKQIFENFEEDPNRGTLQLASKNQHASIEGAGAVKLKLFDDNYVKLQNTLFVPSLTTNLLSVNKITEKGSSVVFKKDKAIVLNPSGKVTLKAEKKNGLYLVNSKEYSENAKLLAEPSIINWHKKLGHMNEADLKGALKNELLKGLDFNPEEKIGDCETCIKGKFSRLPFKCRATPKHLKLLEIVHSDVCGPMKVASPGGSRYFVTFIDECSRYSRVYFLKHKNEVFKFFQEYKNEVENFTGKKIKNFQSDNEISEYCNEEFTKFLKLHGIKRRLSAPYTPQQNGLSERKNRTLLDKARCLLIESNSPPELWAEAIHTANYLSNRSPSRVIEYQTPFEKWVGRIPSVNHLHVFGLKAYVLNKRRKGKFDPRANSGMFVGYSEHSKAYRIWMPDQRKVIVTRDVKILNSFFYSKCREGNCDLLKTDVDIYFHETERKEIRTESESENIDQLSLPDEDEIKSSTSEDESEEINEGEETRPKRKIRPPIWTHDYDMSAFCEIDEALKSADAKSWEEAIKNELISHLKNDTWKILEKKTGNNVIGCKIILKNKFKANGELERKKARLVAKGFNQRPELDYTETYAPVAKLSSIRLLLAIAVEENLTLNKLDVSTAFLNGDIDEEIFMQIPDHLEKFLCEIMLDHVDTDTTIFIKARNMLESLRNGKSEKVCQLQKALYGLKQAGHQWFKKLDKKLRELEFKPSTADPCIYVSIKGEDKTIVAIYVDDLIVATNKKKNFEKIKKELMTSFEMRHLGKLKYCLGIEFSHKNEKIFMSQQKYIEDILEHFHMSDCKPAITPIELSLKLYKNSTCSDTNYPYQNLIGSLMYLSIASRPDISYAVSYLSQFNHCYGQEHWKAAKRVLRYLQNTKNIGLVFRKTGKPLEGFADSDWASCCEDRKSYTGCCFKYGGTVVSWESRKQQTTALSSAEAEYMALTEAAKEAIHLKALINDMGKLHETIVIFNDNKSANNMSKNAIISSKSKHISIKEHFIREKVQAGEIIVKYKPTEIMEADILTKGLCGSKHTKFMELIGMEMQL